MGLDNPRIEDLRRRVQKDPASIAFAQLAEEYRRAGDYEQAIHVCRAGLAQHPAYLSARVTLGRALIELGELGDAQRELELVLRAAPENLAAVRALADIHQRRAAPAGPIGVIDVPDAESPIPPLDRAYLHWTSSDAGNPVASAAFIRPDNEALEQLEAWLAALVADRQRRNPSAR